MYPSEKSRLDNLKAAFFGWIRMLSHDYAVVFIQIEHSVFVCKVRKQKRYSKVGFFRMDTIEVRILLVSKTGAAEAAPVV